MTPTEELLLQAMSVRGWYKELGETRANAYDLKKRLKLSTLSRDKQRDLLIKLGYKMTSDWVWLKE